MRRLDICAITQMRRVTLIFCLQNPYIQWVNDWAQIYWEIMFMFNAYYTKHIFFCKIEIVIQLHTYFCWIQYLFLFADGWILGFMENHEWNRTSQTGNFRSQRFWMCSKYPGQVRLFFAQYQWFWVETKY